MSIILTVDEMLDILHWAGHDDAVALTTAVEAVAELVAVQVQKVLEVKRVGHATYEGTGFGGTAATFNPLNTAQPVPHALKALDFELTAWAETIEEMREERNA